MKKIFAALTALALISCSNNDTEDTLGPGMREDPKDRTVRIFATPISAENTPAPLMEQHEDGNIWWQAGDKIGVVMHDGVGICSEIYTAQSIGRLTGRTEFSGTMTFEENGVEHTFYAYYPETGEVAAQEPARIPVTVPATQEQQGTTKGFGILVAEPARATAPADQAALTPEVDLRFHQALTAIEIRLAAYKAADMKIESIAVIGAAGAAPLSVAGATMDITQPLGDKFAVIEGGTGSESATLNISGDVLLPTSQELTIDNTPGTPADPEKLFAAQLMVCPGDFSGSELTIRITTSKGLFSFKHPGGKLARGQKYVATFVLGEDEPDKSVWDGTSAEPETMDHSAKTISIANGSELAWLAGAVNGAITENVPDASFAGYTVTLTQDIDLGGTVEWTPIGKAAATPFRGNLLGKGHAITNMKFPASSEVAGLVGYAEGESITACGLIEGIKVSGVGSEQLINGTLYFGGICAYATNMEIRDCNVEAKIKHAASLGIRYGGIVGLTKSVTKLSGCSSSGSIAVDKAGRVGGIVGSIEDSSEASVFTRCTSDASFTAVLTGGSAVVGGICGYSKIPISYCLFSGEIDNATDGAGICGLVGSPTVVITGCRNAAVSIRGTRAAGIVAQVNKNSYKVDITACYNTGKITSLVSGSDGQPTNSYAAGILAWHRGSLVGSVNACYNAGTIEGVGTVGSIYANRNTATIAGCFVTTKGAADGSDANITLFGDGTQGTGWPSATDANWGVVEGENPAGEGKYWKPYTRFTSNYPSLWWEK